MFANKEYVYEVYRERSFSKAAENLYISQSALSLAIKKVENRIGTQIFDRSTNPIRLTESGVEYIKCVEHIMDVENGYQNFLSELTELRVGSLTIGGSNFFSSYILPPYITKFKAKYPKVKLDLVESNTASLEKSLFTGELDLIVDNSQLDAEVFEKMVFYSEEMLLAVPRELPRNDLVVQYQLSAEDIMQDRHRQESAGCVPMALFDHAPFLLLKQGNDTRNRADMIFERYGIHPAIILELDQMATAYNTACYGLGIAVISDTLVKVTLPDPRVVYYKISDEQTQRETFLYYKKNKYLTRAMQEFLSLAKGGALYTDANNGAFLL